VCAAAAQTAIDPLSSVPMLGASGAISAVLAAYVFLYPRSPITVLNPIFLLWFFFGLFLMLPAWIVIGEFFVINLINAFGGSAQGGVAFMAHVGGFVGGAVLFRLFLVGRPRLTDYERHGPWVQRRGQVERWN
jgi:membrane associated rhomboid family serine protease